MNRWLRDELRRGDAANPAKRFYVAATAALFVTILVNPIAGFLGYVVFAAELVGGLLLVLGVRVRIVASALVPVLIGATLVHAGNGWLFTAKGGGWEYPALLVVLAVAVALLGEGALALSARGERSLRPQPAAL
jgi:putative oxidoreductase